MTSCYSSLVPAVAADLSQLHDVTHASRLRALAAAAGGTLLALDAAGPLATVAWATCAGNGSCSLAAAVLPSEALVAALATALAAAAAAGPARTVADRPQAAGATAAVVGQGTLGEGSPQASTDRRPRLRGLAIGIGPGSFTGLRVALSAAKGLAWGASALIYPVCSLALLACSAGPGWYIPVADARQGRLFSGLFEVTTAGELRLQAATAVRSAAEIRDLQAQGQALALRTAAAPVLIACALPQATSGQASPDYPWATALGLSAPRPVIPWAGAALLLAAAAIRCGAGADLAALAPTYGQPLAIDQVLA